MRRYASWHGGAWIVRRAGVDEGADVERGHLLIGPGHDGERFACHVAVDAAPAAGAVAPEPHAATDGPVPAQLEFIAREAERVRCRTPEPAAEQGQQVGVDRLRPPFGWRIRLFFRQDRE